MTEANVDAIVHYEVSEKVARIVVTDAAQEGIRAFVEKRPPKW